jgi:4'-phosphopantetheinyl transferase
MPAKITTTVMEQDKVSLGENRALPIKRLTSPDFVGAAANVALWLIGPTGPAGVPEDLWNDLAPDERDRANRFHRAQDRTLFALTRAVLRNLLGEVMGVSPAEIVFAQGPYGKPLLTGTSGPHFNVSHSGAWALIGFSDRRPIGVDIEFMRAAGDELKLARSFFSDAEYRHLAGLEATARLQAFYQIWTCKEAVLKAYGAGISEHLKNFSVQLTSQGFHIHPEVDCFSRSFASVAAGQVEVPEGYAASYALA